MNTEMQATEMLNEGGMIYPTVEQFEAVIPQEVLSAEPPVQVEEVTDNVTEEKEVNLDEAMALMAIIQAKIDELKALEAKLVPTVAVKGVKKNQRPGKPTAGRKYVLLTDKLAMWGKVPQQQQDIAAILVSGMVVGKEYSEAEVFDMLVEGAGDFKSIYTSAQDPTYLFRYYRGLKNDSKHAGFIARNFIRQIG